MDIENMLEPLLDSSDADSLVNKVDGDFKNYLCELPKDMIGLPEQEIRKKISSEKDEDFDDVITMAEDRIRWNFWNEYASAKQDFRPMMIERCYFNVCGKNYFYNVICKNKYKLGWILTPTISFMDTLEAMLNKSISKLHDIVNIPMKEGGEIKPENVRIVMDAIRNIENRVKGMYTQRSESKNLSVSISQGTKDALTDEEIDKKLKKLELALAGDKKSKEEIILLKSEKK